MERELQQRIEEATKRSGIDKLDFVALLNLIDEHYDKMEATITQSLNTRLLAPTTAIDLFFDSVADALTDQEPKAATVRTIGQIPDDQQPIGGAAALDMDLRKPFAAS